MILEGQASEILHDYADGIYTLVVEDEDLKFVDENGQVWELSPEVLYYLQLIPSID